MKSLKIASLEQIAAAAEEFLRETKAYRLFAFYAPMGTGKTTFITALCHALGVTEVVNSPTFAIVNRYSLPGGDEKLYHIDCYRLNKLEEAVTLGFDDYLSSGDRCFIEWPEVIAPLLPEDTLKVIMEEAPDGSRIISFDEQNATR